MNEHSYAIGMYAYIIIIHVKYIYIYIYIYIYLLTWIFNFKTLYDFYIDIIVYWLCVISTTYIIIFYILKYIYVCNIIDAILYNQYTCVSYICI